MTWWWGKGRREWGESTCLIPLANKDLFQWKATVNLDTGTQALIDLIPRCPFFSEVAAKSPPPLQSPAIDLAPPLSTGLLMSQPLIFRVKKGEIFLNHKYIYIFIYIYIYQYRDRYIYLLCVVHFVAHLKIMWTSGLNLHLPELSLKWH